MPILLRPLRLAFAAAYSKSQLFQNFRYIEQPSSKYELPDSKFGGVEPTSAGQLAGTSSLKVFWTAARLGMICRASWRRELARYLRGHETRRKSMAICRLPVFWRGRARGCFKWEFWWKNPKIGKFDGGRLLSNHNFVQGMRYYLEKCDSSALPSPAPSLLIEVEFHQQATAIWAYFPCQLFQPFPLILHHVHRHWGIRDLQQLRKRRPNQS